MTVDEKNIILRILTLLVESCSQGFAAVPKTFRPTGIQKRLDEAKELLARLKAGDA